ncbi:serine hydrolase [Candidatus Daviesbacteria bacterium]|nr:serine hydrolase [Candidatus Daviesbacteria bacterium]
MKKVALLLILLMGGLITYSQLGKPVSYNFSFRLKDDDLKSVVENVLKDSEGRYGIYIKNFKSKETYVRNEHDKFQPASLYKIWVLGTVLTKIKEGQISEDDSITADVAALNEKFESKEEDADLETGVVNFTIKSALEQMIVISHNYAAFALIEKVGKGEIRKFLEKYSLDESSIDTEFKTTASDLGKLFEGIYRGEIIDTEYSQKMLELLLAQQRNDRIPKYLPEGTLVAHKTGELPNIRNDAGIVYCCKQELAHSPNGDFVIVILSETGDVTFASDTIAKISEAVYKYFNL